MADYIKGLSIKIGADTADFISALKKADKQINNTHKQINALIQGLNIEWNESKFIEAQKLAQKNIDDTEAKTESLRKQIKHLEDAGQIDTVGYENLKTELIKVQTQAVKAKSELDKVNKMPFDNLLKDADKKITNTQGKVEELKKSLKSNWDNKKFEELQKQARKHLEATQEKANLLKARLEDLQDVGKVDTQEYKDLELELLKIDNVAEDCKKQLDDINKLKTDHSQAQLDKLGAKITDVGKKVSGLSVISGTALAGLTKLGFDAIQTGDDIATLADQYDMSTYAIQKWQYVAMQSDTSTATLLKGAKKIKSAVAEQINGTVNDSTKALDELGISLRKYGSNEKAFDATIDAISKLQDVSQQTYYANLIFGENVANEMIPLFQQGEEAINSFVSEFETIGYLSDDTITQLANFDNELNIIKTQFSQTALEIGVAFLPVLKTIAEFLQTTVIPLIQSFSNWFSNLSPSSRNAVAGIMVFITALGPCLILTGKLITSFKTIIPLLSKLRGQALKTAFGFTAIVGAFALIFDLIGDWKKMSTVEKILKSVAIAALIAAAAVTVFHASWSLGIAVGVIAAGIAVGIAAINAAKKDILGDEDDDIDFDYNPSDASFDQDGSLKLQPTDKSNLSNAYYNNVADNSSYNINIIIEKNEYVSTDEIVDQVGKKLALKLQSRG